MSADRPQTDTPPDEELVAYLDGELDAQAARRIEDWLASNPDVRRKLHELERTWELIGELDGARLGGTFAQSTLELVTAAVEQDVRQSQAQAPRLRRRGRLLFSLLLLAAGLAGFLTVSLAVPDPNRQILDDLPLLENLDQYRQVQSIEFLRMLQQEKLFVEEEGTE